jgi:hypothetical protein
MTEPNKMKLIDLYNRVVETTGLEIITLPSLQAAISNCMADLTSRGYKTFREFHLEQAENLKSDVCILSFKLPPDLRKAVYLRLFFNNDAVIATRYSLSNKRVACKYLNGNFRSVVMPGQAIYYIKEDRVIVEWHSNLGPLVDLSFGYYQRLVAPKIDTNISDVDQLRELEFEIRPEFEDAVVLYAAYFYYSRYVKDKDKIQLYLSNYKYYIEDITHELAYEDDFNEEDSVIRYED